MSGQTPGTSGGQRRRPHLRRAYAAALLLLIGAGAAVLVMTSAGPRSVDAFLDRHWAHPLPPQGAPPASLAPAEASLDPASCATCHPAQYRDWQRSPHSQTMGPGIRWQFHLFGQADSNTCMNCHAPLAEQKALVAIEEGWPDAPPGAPPLYVPADLHRNGLACAACHVREHQRFGPPSLSGTRGDEPGLPHGGFRVHPAFEDSRFCASCHQFAKDGPRLAGKLRQDTYEEWLRSPFAQAGTTCQSCHMPNRRHEWRGISDESMVRQALSIDTALEPAADALRVAARVTNTGAGHRFPTYLVPRVDLRLLAIDAAGQRRELARHRIQWRASIDLTEEQFDTRLEPGQAVLLEGTVPLPAATGTRLQVEVDVAPKEHYERMYRDMLQRHGHELPRETLALLRLALQQAEAARYTFLALDQPILTPIAK